MDLRVKDIMTKEELSEIDRLNKEIMLSSTKMEIRYFRQEIKEIIQKAKDRYYGNHHSKTLS